MHGVLDEYQARIASLESARLEDQRRFEEERKRHSEEMERLVVELQESREMYASLRGMIQVNDSREPGVVVRQLAALNIDLKNVADRITDKITDLVDPNGKKTSLIFDRKLDPYDAPELVVKARNGQGRRLDLFLMVVLRSMICRLIYHKLSKFHPETNQEDEKWLSDCYKRMRRDLPQVDAARWRIATYQYFDRIQAKGRPPAAVFAEQGQKFAGIVSKDLSAKLFGPLGIKPDFKLLEGDLLNKVLKLGADAIAWCYNTRSTYIHLDFHLTGFKPPKPFDPKSMQIYDKYDLRGDGQSEVIAVVGFGLRSSCATGGGKHPEEVWQERVPVVTEEYFE
jgi:hypothetical protein